MHAPTPEEHPRRAIITGATKGIGRATADRFLADGWAVGAVARTGPDLDAAAGAWSAVHGPARVLTVRADVATAEGRAAVVDAVRTRWGAADVLINNVGTNIRKPTLDYTEADIRRILEFNLVGALELTRAMHPLLIAGDEPAIVNVSSVAALRHVGSGVVYAMTKAAIDQMTRYLAVEWAPTPDRAGIRVNSVQPWYIDTPLVQEVLGDPERKKQIIERTPMGRVGEPAEVAAVIGSLAGAGGYVTGQCVACDGGYFA